MTLCTMAVLGSRQHFIHRCSVGLVLVLGASSTQAQTLRAFLRFTDRILTREVENGLVRSGLEKGCSIHFAEMLRQRGPLLLSRAQTDPSLKELLDASLSNLQPSQMERLGVFIHSGSTQLQKWMPSWVVDVGTSHRSADLEKLGNWIGEDLETAGLEPLSFEPTSSGLRFHGSGQSLRFVKQRWKDVWSQRVLDLNQLALAEAEISEFATVEEVIGNLIQQRFALLKGLPTSSREPANAGMRAQAAEHGKTRETLANLLREIHQKIRTQKSPSEQAAIDRVYKEQQRVTESQLKKLSQQMLNPAQRNDDQFLVWATLESRQLEAKAWFEAQTH